MLQEQMVEKVVREVLSMMQKNTGPIAPATQLPIDDPVEVNDLVDIAGEEERKRILIDAPADREALERMMEKTSARIGIGKSGPRLKTSTLLMLRADHAAAQDSVFTDMNTAILEKMGLFAVQTLCKDRNQHLTRPDLGRQFSEDTLKEIRSKCKPQPRVQIYVSDGLSSKAIEANIESILPALINGLNQYGIEIGTPFFVKFGRVPSMEPISETLESEVTCVLIGERPGLATSKSMSAYIAYKATVGMPESRRTVVSNIHSGGLSAPEAGAYISDVIKKMLELRVSGVELKM